jgi:hypothetical protein
MWILGKGHISWWSEERKQFDLEPWPNDTIAYAEAAEEIDILLPFVLALNILFARVWTHPLRLTDYAGDAMLGQNVRVWNDD